MSPAPIVLAQSFNDYSVAKLRQYLERIEVCLRKLSDDQIWSRGHDSENSVGNLCLHLTGNIRQWILTGVGGEEDQRNRDAEFQASGGITGEELRARLSDAVTHVCELIPSLTPARLEQHVTVQGYRVTVLEAVYHVVEHFSHHTGQILFATKALSREELGFYRHVTHLAHNEKTP